MRLPTEKMERLTSMVQQWGNKVYTRKELESQIGLLNHACKVVHPCGTFLRQMIDLLTATGAATSRHPNHHIRLSKEFRADLSRWHLFLHHWNGVVLIKPDTPSSGKEFASDASGSWGFRAWSWSSWFNILGVYSGTTPEYLH